MRRRPSRRSKRNRIREIFIDTNGATSSKRVMTFLSFLIMMVISYVSIIMGKNVEQFIFDGFLYIVVGGLFSVASEKFAQRFSGGYNSYNNFDQSREQCESEPSGSEYQTNINRWEANGNDTPVLD